MMCFLLLFLVLLGLGAIGLGLYALITGQINLPRGSIQGAPARLLGLLLIVAAVVGFPIMLRGLAGLGMNLGR
jgi:hypothetical protein